MHLALPGSALVHAGVVSVLLVGFAWPETEDAAPPAPVTVNIVTTSTVASNATEVIASDNTVSAISSGSPEALEPVEETLEPETPETVTQDEPAETAKALAEPIEPVEASAAEPAEQAAVEPVELAAIEPVELGSTAQSALSVAPATPVEPQSVAEAVEPVTEAALEPVEVGEMVAMPTPRSERPPDRPRPQPEPQPERRPEPQPRERTAAPGNQGNSNADSAASAGGAPPQASSNGSGGQAEVARYPSQVTNRVRSALRRISSGGGEVVVRFTVSANGQLSGVSIARSSGNPAVDNAGIAAVQRGAPYPPIPPAAGRNSWPFEIPLAFGR